MESDARARSLSARWRDAVLGAGPPVLVALLLLLLLALWAAFRVLDPTPDKHLVIATGPAQGAYVEFAKGYLPLLRANGLTVELRPTQGPRQNLDLLRDAASGVHAAFVQGGVDGLDGDAGMDVMSLGSVADEPVWLFYREASAVQRLGRATLTGLSQLARWRVNTGPAGSGSQALLRLLTQANAVPPGELVLGHEPTVNGVVDMLQGRTDAVLLVASADAPLVQYLLRTPGVRLLDFPQAEAYSRRYPFLRTVTLPRGIVDLAADEPPQDMHLVAVTASLVAREGLHPALVQLLVQAAQQVHGKAGWFNRAGEYPNATAPDLPLAPDAARIYRDGLPWLQRYLPFWLANFVDRMWIVLVPLVAVMIPLSRVLPPLVTLRVRSRVYRWYAHLRAVERALERPQPGLDGLRAEIERIDNQVERIGVPLSFTHELYELRSHIHLVRKRILDRQSRGV